MTTRFAGLSAWPYICLLALACIAINAQPIAYVANVGGNNMAVINSQSFSLIGSPVPVPAGPTALAVTPDGSTVYITSSYYNSVSAVNTSNRSVVASISLGGTPMQVAISPNGSLVYVILPDSNQIAVINNATKTLTGTIPVGSHPSSIAFSPDGTRAYVANLWSNTVSVIDTSYNTVVSTFATTATPEALTVSPNGRIYIAHEGSNTVTVHDASGSVVAVIGGFAYPVDIAVTPNGARVLVVNQSGDSVSLIDTGSNTVVGTAPVGNRPTSISISADGTQAYVSNEFGFSVTVLRTSDGAVFGTVPSVGIYPVAVATTPPARQVQAPPPAQTCSYQISPGSASFGPTGGVGYVSVSAPAGCSWNANSNSGWLSILYGSSGSGSGTVAYSAGANSSAAGAYGSLTVAGQSFAVSEAGVAVVATSSSAATFVKLDSTTQGNWRGAYGSDGYAIANDSTTLPAYAQVSMRNQSNYTWAGSSSDGRALQNAGGRIASTWFAPSSSFDIDVNLTDASSHQVSLYALDWDTYRGGRAERIDILDANTGAVLDTRQVANFTAGQYLVWNVAGHVIFRITLTGGGNAVISGLFFGGGAVGPGSASTSANFMKTDSTTQGDWKGVYGSGGYAIANDSNSLPAYAQVSLRNQYNYTWAGSSGDRRALQNAGGRIASTWFAPSSSFDIDVNLTDASSHQVSLYALDWDALYGGRAERIDVLDANTGAVLDTRYVAGFAAGQYLAWNVAGHVVFRITLTGGVNAVISGVFFN